MGRGTNIRMARAVQTARQGLGKSQSQGARVSASRLHQAHVEKAMQSRMVSPDRLLGEKIDYRPISQRFRGGRRAAEKITLWDSWLRRDSLKAIGRALASRHRYLLPTDPKCCVDRLRSPPKADKRGCDRIVRYVPLASFVATQKKAESPFIVSDEPSY